MAIRALVVDDEPLSRRVLRQLAMRHADLDIVRECRDGIEALEALRELDVDVVFLDVRMPGASGLDVVQGSHLSGRPHIIFVTAHERFAVPAFELAATDYLVKPVTQERFDRALARVKERMQQAAAATSTEVLPSRGNLQQRVTIQVDGADIVLRPEDIEYVVAENVYAVIHTDRRPYRLRATLAHLMQQLDPTHFFRVHRSFLVRLDRVRAVQGGATGGMAVLASGRRIPVGRRRRRALEHALATEITARGG